MRIISGKHKGKPLKAVPGMKTRPTSDKVKEAVFHRIGPYFDGGDGLDLYAGTGNLGMEAISRGFHSFIFVDISPAAVKVIKQNLKTMGLFDCCEVYRNEAKRAISALSKREKSFDLILLDPPYAEQDLENILTTISETGLLKENGQIVCEHRSSLELPEKLSSLCRTDFSIYGDTGVTIYKIAEGGYD